MPTADAGIRRLIEGKRLTREDALDILAARTPQTQALLAREANDTRNKIYGTDVYIRGLIEFTNICRNNCLYCGLRRDNTNAQRYRLSEDEILACCEAGYALGYRTFVLQGGEDPLYGPDRIESLVSRIRAGYPDCAITLSVGEAPREVYETWFRAGANRYLLRHETANEAHYRRLHPAGMSFANRIRCLYDLKNIGYAVGCGMMVGSPGQTAECLADDLLFMQELQPDMVGIGPFIPHCDTPFRDEPAGSFELTLYLLSVIRLMLPEVLLPATTALGTIDPLGRERGIQAGANVCMPNLSPADVRKKYALYDNILCTGDEAAESRSGLERRMEAIGYRIVVSRGDKISTKGVKST